jgi:type IV pilus assembly protein PilC
MNKYKYKAIDAKGTSVKGYVEGETEFSAARLLKKRGLTVLSLKFANTKLAAFFPSIQNRVSKGDVAIFTRQLATMVNAGLPIVEALTILRVQSKPSLQNIFSQVLADVEGGESLNAAIKKHPKVFSPTYVALVKAGETGGVLDKVLVRLADDLEKQQEFRGKVKGALIYPMIIVIGMIAVSIFMVVFVIPKLSDLYSQFDAELPLSTRAFLFVSKMVTSYWYITVIIIFVAFIAYRAYSKTENGKTKISEFVFKIPIFGPLQKEIILTELTRTMSLMVGAGVSILESLTITADVVDNVIIGGALKDVQLQIEKGFPVAFAFAKHPEAFPYILSQMVAVGEETGKMEEVLGKVSHVFEVDSEQKVKTLTAAIEPLIMIVLGVGVAVLVIAIILPIYNLTTVI